MLGTFNLLDRCVATGARSFALMSSPRSTVKRRGTRTIGENSRRLRHSQPAGLLLEGKRAAEHLRTSYAKQYDMHCTVPRFGHIYGPGMALGDGRVQADFAAAVMAGRDVTLNNAGTASRTYTYVADAVSGFFYAMLRGDSATAYSIADPAGLVSIRELANLFVAARREKGCRCGSAAGRSVGVQAAKVSQFTHRSAGLAASGGAGRGH
ncbi:MAG: NAD(P)-dependent oxidoreductase [Micropruina glycogenica]